MEIYENIWYLDCPHFTVGRVDQWGESGYLLFEAHVYSYEEDRKDQCGRTYGKMTIPAFIAHADWEKTEIPDEFMQKLKEVEGTK